MTTCVVEVDAEHVSVQTTSLGPNNICCDTTEQLVFVHATRFTSQRSLMVEGTGIIIHHDVYFETACKTERVETLKVVLVLLRELFCAQSAHCGKGE